MKGLLLLVHVGRGDSGDIDYFMGDVSRSQVREEDRDPLWHGLGILAHLSSYHSCDTATCKIMMH